jgi:2'-5' RNA ligase
VHSVELIVDDDSDRKIRAQWATLAMAGLPSQARHTGSSNRPHITLALTETLTGDALRRLEDAVSTLPLATTVGGLLIFGSRRFVLARLVIPSSPLLELQNRVTAALDDQVDPHRNFGPGGWTPHVTLARRLTADQVGIALLALGGVSDITGTAVRARRWDISAKVEHWLEREADS